MVKHLKGFKLVRYYLGGWENIKLVPVRGVRSRLSYKRWKERLLWQLKEKQKIVRLKKSME